MRNIINLNSEPMFSLFKYKDALNSLKWPVYYFHALSSWDIVFQDQGVLWIKHSLYNTYFFGVNGWRSRATSNTSYDFRIVFYIIDLTWICPYKNITRKNWLGNLSFLTILPEASIYSKWKENLVTFRDKHMISLFFCPRMSIEDVPGLFFLHQKHWNTLIKKRKYQEEDLSLIYPYQIFIT